ncbi:MAG: hypothetical protein RLZZ135_2402 [Cyanobacteriota bacterium]|jgi:hypothetical protein
MFYRSIILARSLAIENYLDPILGDRLAIFAELSADFLHIARSKVT